MSGCVSNARWEANAAKCLIPVNAAVAYFGNVALHEGAHALAIEGFGAEVTSLRVLPEIHLDHLYFGSVKYIPNGLSDTERTVINTMGPTSTFLAHMLSREMLKLNVVPPVVQPTVAWFGLFGRISYYYQILKGFFRIDYADLGKEPVWITVTMFAGSILYEVYDFFFSDVRPDHQFLVLIGEHFYEDPPKRRSFEAVMLPIKDGAFLGFQFKW